jgi:Aerobic-type carbon monoxide dehydrogenase, middle subunit CoxM/CutM homologs
MKQLDLQEYFVADSLAEALELLDTYAGTIEVVAGGTDAFVEEHPGLDAMLDITKLGLDFIEQDGKFLRIGSCATFRTLAKSSAVRETFHSLWEAAAIIADYTIRNIATVGGNICSAVPSGDAIPSMYAADAVFVLASRGGERKVPAEEFFVGPRRTVRAKNELLKEILVPLPQGRAGSAFEKVARNSVDLANANVAVRLLCAADGAVQEARIAFGAVAPTVVRAHAAEAILAGRKPDEALLAALAGKVPEAISPITNIRSTREYRTEVAGVLAKKAVERAYRLAAA